MAEPDLVSKGFIPVMQLSAKKGVVFPCIALAQYCPLEPSVAYVQDLSAKDDFVKLVVIDFMSPKLAEAFVEKVPAGVTEDYVTGISVKKELYLSSGKI